ncbi:hypothetical protein KEJ21_05385 [Candidatus Bathyarchaeota archaeon]|nr:hypothetical protein [Candidatus Bathyarchaeota archaeon]MBS7630846.1 hypothetical protein [Candidatus Bathyarchaeota archaeon]
MVKDLKGEKAEKFIIDILRSAGKPLTTREIQQETEKRLVRCPDSTIVFLTKLRNKGSIRGELSASKRGWIWWVES